MAMCLLPPTHTMVGCAVCAIKHSGWGLETNTALGFASCCIGLLTPPLVL